MKTFEELRESVCIGTGGIAGSAEAGDSPPVRKKDQKKLIRRNKFMSNEVFEVPSDIYNQILRPKLQKERFRNIIGHDDLGEAIRQYAIDNPGKGIIVQCENTGAMTWLRLPRAKKAK